MNFTLNSLVETYGAANLLLVFDIDKFPTDSGVPEANHGFGLWVSEDQPAEVRAMIIDQTSANSHKVCTGYKVTLVPFTKDPDVPSLSYYISELNIGIVNGKVSVYTITPDGCDCLRTTIHNVIDTEFKKDW